MSKVVDDTAQDKVFPPNFDKYTKAENFVTNDEIIDAYLAGGKSGLEHSKKLALDKLKENIEKSADLTSKMLEFLKSIKINPISSHLKIKSFNRFTILITLSEDEFLSEKFLEAYNIAFKMEKETKADEYYDVMFMFSERVPEKFNEDYIISEGYFLEYNN
ncbi:hypothetical protein MNBD_BACTEROID03-1372 [hydrothermal vent metagenome]|uniref:Uncharacterized protein n=1 Tax=hydrothermal vent metagenome TaxID=652676 RepID=A0A3B0SXM4_9ZZZZ